jgi:hypothetical protein
MKLFLMLCSIILSACTSAQSTLPSRHECIVRVEFNDNGELEDIYPLLSSLVRQSKRNGFVALPPSVAIPAEARSLLYMQYKEMCSQREELTRILFKNHIEGFIKNLPEYKISVENIKPSPSTIDVQGVYWAD